MDTKERILNRTGELFMLMGMKNLTMDFIATDLGISKRTIYELFRDKEDLIFQTIESGIRKDNCKLLEIVNQSGNVIEAIFVIIERQHTQMVSHSPLILEDLKKYMVKLNAEYYSSREKIRGFSVSYTLLEKGIREGIFKKELKIDVVDNFLHELISMFHNSERIRLMHLNRKDGLENIVLPYFRGICTMKGLELMDSYIGNLEIIKHE